MGSYKEYRKSLIKIINNKIEDNWWNLACYEDSIDSYTNYLSYCPNGKHSQEAKENLDILIEITRKIALEEQRIREIENVKERVRLEKIEQERKLALDKEEKAWELVLKKNIKEDYKNYLLYYPNGSYAKIAKFKINKLIALEKKRKLEAKKEQKEQKAIEEENKTWELVCKGDTQLDYENYLLYFPKGTYAKSAKFKINEFILLEKKKKLDAEKERLAKKEHKKQKATEEENETWELVCRGDTQLDYENYLRYYPNGIYINNAKIKIDEFIALEKKKRLIIKEKEVWKFACKKNTKYNYYKYLSKYPSGIYKDKAQLKINEFIKKEKEELKCTQIKIIEFHDEIEIWLDIDTELVWEVKTRDNVEDCYTWKGAFFYAEKLNTQKFAGFNDWKVPNEKELKSILAKGKRNNFYIKIPLSKNTSNIYWSSDEFISDSAYSINFKKDAVKCEEKNYIRNIRCVRKSSIDKEKESWELTCKGNTQLDYENYLRYYSTGIYMTNAKNKIDEFITLEKKKRLEEEAWKLACKNNNYYMYLLEYPNGIYRDKAELRKNEFIKEERFNEHKETRRKEELKKSFDWSVFLFFLGLISIIGYIIYIWDESYTKGVKAIVFFIAFFAFLGSF